MSRTEQLLAQAREAEINRVSGLQRNLPSTLERIDEPAREQFRADLAQLNERFVSLLDEGIDKQFISESDYRRLMNDQIDRISLDDLLDQL